MKTKSPLSNLRDVLSQVKDAAKTYGTTLTSNEDATRAALIDPLLRALGWDTAQVNMVEVEKTAKGARADYALRDTSGVQVIIEAKKLNDNLSQHALGLINDAYAFQVTSVFLTNGLVWQHFTSFAPQGFRPFKEYDLEKDDLGEIAAYLVQTLDAANYWPEEQTVDVLAQDVAQLRSDVNTMQQQVAKLIDQVTKLIGDDDKGDNDKDDDDKDDDGVWVDLNNLTALKGKKPSRLRLPGGREVPAAHWTTVLAECCKYALAENPVLVLPLSDSAGKTVNLIDWVAPSVNHVAVPYQGRTAYIRLNYQSDYAVANAIYVLSNKIVAAKVGAKAAVELQ